MTITWNQMLVDQLEFAWDYQFLPRMEGLTDDEYLREPVPGCWNVYQGNDGRWTWPERRFPEPDPPPFTTIAWRMTHISVEIFGERASNHFGDGSCSAETATIPGTADEAIALITEKYTAWRDGVIGLGEEGLLRPCGPAEGPFAEFPMAALVLHINREFLHHAAEIMLLRDLYRARDREDTPPS
jgi:hypothetical protein